MNTKYLSVAMILLIGAMPQDAYAQSVQNIIYEVGRAIDFLLPVAVSLALLTFIWGLIKYLWRLDNEEARKQGKSLMTYGILALFVMVSIWGIVIFIGRSIGIYQGGSIQPPTIQRGGSSGFGGSGSYFQSGPSGVDTRGGYGGSTFFPAGSSGVDERGGMPNVPSSTYVEPIPSGMLR